MSSAAPPLETNAGKTATNQPTIKRPGLGGFGNNPSTWVGVEVLAALAFLSFSRRYFKRYR